MDGPYRKISIVAETLPELQTQKSIRTARDAESYLRPLFEGSHVEVFIVVLLDSKHRITGYHEVSRGCLSWSVVHPREVFLPAVQDQAAAIIVAHNHPSGDAAPSRQDYDVTERLAKSGELLGIPLLDHLVFGDELVSIREQDHTLFPK
jgi:DNA repair protein RadC